MSESATDQPQSEEEWTASLEEDLDLSDIDGMDDDAATSEDAGSPLPPEDEGDDPIPPEGDAEAQQEGPAGDAAAGEAEAEVGEEPGGDPAEAPQAEADPGQADPAATDQQATGTEYTWEPWVGKADGEEIRIPDAQVSDAGLFIPKASIPKLQEHLADRGSFYRQLNQVQAQLRRKSGAEAHAENFIETITELMSDKDKFLAFIDDFEVNGPRTVAEARAAREAARAESLQQDIDSRTASDAEREFVQSAPDRIGKAVRSAIAFDEWKDLGLNPEAVTKEVLNLGLPNLFYRLDQDTEVAPGKILPKGAVLLQSERVLQVVRAEARVARARQEAGQRAAAATQAAKQRNNGKQRGNRPKGAPAVQSTGTPVPAGRERKQPQTLEEWRASLHDD